MGRLDDLLGFSEQEEETQDQFETIGGTYQCQKCNEVVYSATYIHDDGELIWVCPKNHRSKIVGFYV